MSHSKTVILVSVPSVYSVKAQSSYGHHASPETFLGVRVHQIVKGLPIKRHLLEEILVSFFILFDLLAERS